MKEYLATSRSGLMMLAVLPAAFVVSGFALLALGGALKLIAILALILVGIGFFGFYMVQPNQCAVLQLFGRYVGSDLQTGLRWANPFYSKQKVSLRVRNFESGKLKVNDHSGNPVEIASVVVWKVVDSAEAVFEVEDYENFVSIQSEAALRFLASSYPYEAADDTDISLRSNGPEVTDLLRGEIQARLEKAGVEVLEARISHLAYAPEIASAMLQRQQARAVVMARQQLVEGAVGMVELALARLSEKNMVQLDEERKAAMVSNLLVVLCGDHQVQPVINTGTLY
ncbi:MAG: SPFH domain-containing protein [Gammaproteobacteria bacterium]|nr:SPFH domain-containing protein [Gammaproteobacteria bacterium]MBU2059862.1 SPFH domain-containing protein [Gammaproteobacteria bacterium]MBU2175357.1 SPFH domain-containing protein [Gammaproteobacteria bacterium]MBU2245735.1 SPFH domain-containing protein [Gammaproteobacteria bacterium]MBU2345139.1 SPFH domain-containing protein [Gammaproteobacteria bacterium]